MHLCRPMATISLDPYHSLITPLKNIVLYLIEFVILLLSLHPGLKDVEKSFKYKKIMKKVILRELQT